MSPIFDSSSCTEDSSTINQLIPHDSQLFEESTKGHFSIVRSLADRGMVIDSKRDDIGWTALILPIRNGQLKIEKLLNARGTYVNIQDSCGWTALMFASLSGRIESMRLLLVHGAVTYLNDKFGRTALDIIKDQENW